MSGTGRGRRSIGWVREVVGTIDNRLDVEGGEERNILEVCLASQKQTPFCFILMLVGGEDTGGEEDVGVTAGGRANAWEEREKIRIASKEKFGLVLKGGEDREPISPKIGFSRRRRRGRRRKGGRERITIDGWGFNPTTILILEPRDERGRVIWRRGEGGEVGIE